jgi:hypothetical protein
LSTLTGWVAGFAGREVERIDEMGERERAIAILIFK